MFLIYYFRVRDNGGELFLEYAPYLVFSYLIVMSVFVGFLAAQLAKGRWQHNWLWGIIGFAITLLFILRLPSLLPIFPVQSPEIFAGSAIFAFLAPVLSAILVSLLVFTRRKIVA